MVRSPTGTRANTNHQCVQNACAGQACCLPKPQTWQNLPVYEVAVQPTTGTMKVLRPESCWIAAPRACATVIARSRSPASAARDLRDGRGVPGVN
jgi:hypothetical protein